MLGTFTIPGRFFKYFICNRRLAYITLYSKYLSENQKPSVNNFYEWLKTVKNSNYIFMQEAIFTYVYSMFLFRTAVRRNNKEVLIAARTKFFFTVLLLQYDILPRNWLPWFENETSCLPLKYKFTSMTMNHFPNLAMKVKEKVATYEQTYQISHAQGCSNRGCLVTGV